MNDVYWSYYLNFFLMQPESVYPRGGTTYSEVSLHISVIYKCTAVYTSQYDRGNSSTDISSF